MGEITNPGVGNFFCGTFNGRKCKITSSSSGIADSIFIGLGSGARIRNVKSYGSFSISGIVREAYSGAIIENCENYAEISKGSRTSGCGGIVGKLQNGTIKNCKNAGNVSSASDVNYTGGICGWGLSAASIENCINLGKITSVGSNSTLGTIVGKNSGTVKNTYYLIGTANQAIGGSSSVALDVAAQFDLSLKTTNTLTVEGTTSNNLIDLLNAWVNANNSSGAEQYFSWDSVGDNPALVY